MRKYPPGPQRKNSYKFMQALDRRICLILKKQAGLRGVTFQELLRTEIVPEWLHRRGLITIATVQTIPLPKTWKETAYGKGMIKAARRQRHH